LRLTGNQHPVVTEDCTSNRDGIELEEIAMAFVKQYIEPLNLQPCRIWL